MEVTVDNIENVQSKTAKFELFFFLFLFVVISFIWSQLSNGTWDDDAIGRYMSIASKPSLATFIDSWNRPFAVVFLFLPIQLFGKIGLVISMSSLTAFSGFIQYKALKNKTHASAAFIVVLAIFQTFLFGISRDAMTEPIASFLISVGIYAYYKEKWVLFALIGSLLPIARSELVLFLPFWGLVLLKANWKLIPLLGAGLFLWWAGCFIESGKPMYFFQEVLKNGANEKGNRYGHTEITHQLSKYIVVMGPMVFFFTVLGFVLKLKSFIKEYFIYLQFLVGFLIYVVFSAFLSIGQSNGSLRNLIPLSPFVTVIALVGFDFWYKLTIQKPKKEVVISKPQPKPTLNKKANAKVSNKNQASISNSSSKSDNASFINVLLFISYSFIILLFVAQVNTYKLVLRQNYDDTERDYTILLFLIGVISICFLNLLYKNRVFFIVSTYILIGLQISYTLYTESPTSHENKERSYINTTANLTKQLIDKSHMIYCNHPWFYWASGLNIHDTLVAKKYDSISVSSLKQGDVLIWEGHYNKRYYGNVTIDRINRDTSFIPFLIVRDPDDNKNIATMFFLKKWSSTEQNLKFIQECANKCNQESSIFYFKGVLEYGGLHKLKDAKESFDKVINLNNDMICESYNYRGICNLQLGNKANACEDFKSAVKYNVPEASENWARFCK